MSTTGFEFTELRFVLLRGQRHYDLCRVIFDQNDASFYIKLVPRQSRFFYGQGSIPAGDTSADFKFGPDPDSADPNTHLSIHHSGQVHARVNGPVGSTKPVFSLKLPAFTGQHAVTVVADHMENLSEVDLADPPRGVHYVPLVQRSAEESARITFYVNGQDSRFDDHCTQVVTIRRERLAMPVYVGIRPVAQTPLTSGGVSGILAIAGWKPGVAVEDDVPFVYLRGE